MKTHCHPAESELKQIALAIKDDAVAEQLVTWMLRHIKTATCESLLDKDAHAAMKPEHREGILADMHRRRMMALGALITNDAGIHEEDETPSALRIRTTVWVIR